VIWKKGRSDTVKKLFESASLGALTLKNRLIRAAIWENMAAAGGHPTEQMTAFYEELAGGGAGLIITGYMLVDQEGRMDRGVSGIYDDSFLPEYRRLTDAVHAKGGKIAAQLAYRGTQGGNPDCELWGMSAVAHKTTGLTPHEMTTDEIRRLEGLFADAARRAKAAGFDAVELHAAHGYLLSQSLSPYYNRRRDQYGGSLENRARLLTETCERVREAVGKDYPVLVKLNCSDFAEGEAGFDECEYACRRLDELGIDGVEISGGDRVWATRNKTPSLYAGYAAKIADELRAPVILVGNNRDPEVLEQLLEKTGISFFSLARPFLREPDLAARWERGDRTPSKCVSCGRCYSPQGVGCAFRRGKNP
jgi:2,4-dienoyl-CoA reductase-like NADH-dependent reductase (Old Yellow Enzyme family)